MNRLLLTQIIAVFFVVSLAFVLRFYRVTEIPPSLNWDEASIGYNAYSILKTGRDEWGRSWPVHFEAFGEYKLPVQIYASIPGIVIFGLNEFGVRILPVVYGTLTVLVLFFLARKISKNFWVGFWSAFFLAVSPWHIQLTRASFESSFSVFWVLSGLWMFLKGLEGHSRQKAAIWLVLSTLFFAVSVYTYNAARVFAPLFMLYLIISFRRWFLSRKLATTISLMLFLVLMVPLVSFIQSSGGNSRYKLVSITDDPGLIPRIDQARNTSGLPTPVNQLINNRYSYALFYFGQNYLAHFSPQFLFLSGAPHKQHHVQGVGEMYLFQLPLVLLGLWFLYRAKQPYRWVIVVWILFIFVPVSVTNDSIPNALRTVIAAPMYQLISAFGLVWIFQSVKKRYPNFLVLGYASGIVLFLVSFGFYLYNYYIVYPKAYSRDWQYGYKQVVGYIKNHRDEYDEVVFSRGYGEPHIFTLFFLKYDPRFYQNDPNLVRYETNNWVWVLRFDHFYFPDLGDAGTNFLDIVRQNPGKRLLFIGKPADFPAALPRLDRVYFLNGTEAFDIVGVR